MNLLPKRPRPRANSRSMAWLVLAALVAAVPAAGVGDPAAAEPKVRDLLPNVVPLPTRTLSLGTSMSPFFGGCDPYETTEQGARRCLRYDTIAANFGRGPL